MATNKIIKGHKVRAYLNGKQRLLFAHTNGCCRMIYNRMLFMKRDAYNHDKTSISHNQLSRLLTQMKKTEDYQYLNNVPDTALRQSLIDLNKAYTNFFKKLTDYPTTHERKPGGAGSIRMQDCYIRNGILTMPRFMEMKIEWSHGIPPDGEYMMTLSKDSCGQYYVSYMLEVEVELLPATGKKIGIDVGLKTYAVLSDGTQFENLGYLKRSKKALRRSQRALARAQKDSNRREKKRQKVAKIHKKIANQRNDFQHKLSKQIVENYDVIAMEKLQVANMKKNHRLAGSISDAAWSSFVRKIEYKSKWYGKSFVPVCPKNTSRTCSCCNHLHDTPMTLNIRAWVCANCGAVNDRDLNAAINILNKGMAELNNTPYVVYMAEVPEGHRETDCDKQSTDVDIISSAQSTHGLVDVTGMAEASICCDHVEPKPAVSVLQ